MAARPRSSLRERKLHARGALPPGTLCDRVTRTASAFLRGEAGTSPPPHPQQYCNPLSSQDRYPESSISEPNASLILELDTSAHSWKKLPRGHPLGRVFSLPRHPAPQHQLLALTPGQRQPDDNL